MKKIYLALLAAALVVPIQMQAVNYEVKSIEFGQKYTTNLPPSTGKRSGAIAVSDGKIYTVEGPNDSQTFAKSKKMWVTQSNGSWKSFDLVDNGGRGITNDSEGNILYYHGANNYAGTFPAMAASGTLAVGDMRIGTLTAGSELGTDVYNASNVGMVVEIKNKDWTDGSVTAKDRADNVCAVGDVRNGECDLFFWPSATASIVKITVKASATGITPTKTEIYTYEEASGLKKAGDGRVMVKAAKINGVYHVLLHNSDCTSAYVGTLNASTKKVEGLTKMPYQSKNGTIVVSKKNPTDKQYYIYPSLTATWSGANNSVITKAQIVVQNIKTGETKTSTVSDAIESSSYTTISGNGLLLEAEFDETDDNLIHVYCYQPGKGAWTYDVTLANTDAPAAPVASITLVTNGTAKDAKISWNAVEGAVGYTIEKSTDGKTGWSVLKSGMTELTYSDAGIQGVTSAFYRVKVVAADGTESDYSNVVSVWPSFEPHQPKITGKTWNGHSKVELSWDAKGEGGPSGYNVYRDGIRIATEVVVAHYIDMGVPAGTHEYYVESVYDSKPGVNGQSNTLSIGVEPRAVGNVLYRIEKEYDYEIPGSFASQAASKVPLFTTQDLYRQGKLFKDGDNKWSWYITQLRDVETQSGATDGGIVRFNADAGSASAMAASGERILSYRANASTGLAMDQVGNIFVRERTPYPDGTANAGIDSDWGYGSHFTKGTVYKRGTDGTYSTATANKKTFDFSGLGLDNNRTDYYAAEGNIFSGNGSIFVAGGRQLNGGDNVNAYRLAIRGGEYSSSENLVFTPSNPENVHTENFFFPILPNEDEARDDYIIQVRSSAYVNISNDGLQTQSIYGNTYSRVNNAGGTSVWFNDDLLLITPEFNGSKNLGDFYVAKAVREDLSKPAHPKEAVFSIETMVPVASVQHDGDLDLPADNANGVWFGCVPHYGIAGAAEGDNIFNDTYLSIYMYIPGVRFAKYRLSPYIEMLNPSVTMVVDVETDPEATTITNFVGKAAWKELSYPGDDFALKYFHVNITKQGTAAPLMSFYVKQTENGTGGHDHIICDADGNTIDSDIEVFSESRQEYNEKGQPLYEDDGVTPKTSEWCYVLLDGKKYDIGDSQNCVLAVKATFEKVNDEATTLDSDYSQASDLARYETQKPEGTVIIDQEGVPFKVRDQWTAFPDGPKENGEDGYWSYKWCVNYRVDIDFSKVTATSDDGVTLPVSHYEIYYVPFGSSLGAVSEPVMNFTLLSSDGNLTKTDGKIPGTYDFTKKDYAIPVGDGTSQLKPSVMSFYIQPEVEVTSDNPGKGQFTLKDVNDDPVNG